MYVLSYFTEADEALHLAVSRDGQHFAAVNDGRPVLRGTVGTRTLRDPFIGLGPDGHFHLLATDGWTSTSVVYAASADLITWSEQRLIPVMGAITQAHNAWAPEFFHAAAEDRYYLIWSSVTSGRAAVNDHDFEHNGQDHRIWCCTTQDFRTFSAPRLFFDPGYPVIDATVHVTNDGGYLMAFKDERGSNDLSTEHKDIHVAVFRRPGGPYEDLVGPVTPGIVEGPSLYRRDDVWVMLFDHYLESRYGAATSAEGRIWTTTEVATPTGARHASVLTIPPQHPIRKLPIGRLTQELTV